MGHGMSAVAAGAAGLVGGAIAVRRGRDRGSGRWLPSEETQAVTVLAPLDEVAAGWRDHAANNGLATVEVEFRPAPGGRGAEVLARLDENDGDGAGLGEGFGGQAPRQRLRAELRRFKSVMECDTVVSTEGQPTGRSRRQEAFTRAVTDRLRAWGAA